jgi:hypothetical protein
MQRDSKFHTKILDIFGSPVSCVYRAQDPRPSSEALGLAHHARRHGKVSIVNKRQAERGWRLKLMMT